MQAKTALRWTKQKLDTFVNILTNTGNGKRENTSFYSNCWIFPEAMLTEMYATDWVSRKIINMPVNDAITDTIEIASENEIERMTDEIDRLKVMNAVKEAKTLARLYGGAAIIIVEKTAFTEKEIKQASEIISLNVVDGYELAPSSYDEDPTSERYGQVDVWEYTPNMKGFSAEQGQLLHYSRVIPFFGDYIPKRANRSGADLSYPWCQSVLQSCWEAIRDYKVIDDAVVELAQAIGIKTLSIDGIIELLQSEDGKALLETRAGLVNNKLSAHRTLLIDSNERLDFYSPNLSNIEKIINHGVDQLCGSINMPRQRFFTQQLGTLAGAEETTKAYYDMLHDIRNDIKPLIDSILWRIAAYTGVSKFQWKLEDLSKPDEKTEAETRKIQSEVDTAYYNIGVLSPEEIRNSRFEGGYSSDTEIDNTADLEPIVGTTEEDM